ncbi:uncharacterized protein LOC135849488 isoform X1 [Planococcus citri]|uniref:uncharacterized protein LOC135840001 isoform X1 n=1 Tax=Planococcus citri TaxID=170843 RepID=UPI0031F9B6D1
MSSENQEEMDEEQQPDDNFYLITPQDQSVGRTTSFKRKRKAKEMMEMETKQRFEMISGMDALMREMIDTNVLKNPDFGTRPSDSNTNILSTPDVTQQFESDINVSTNPDVRPLQSESDLNVLTDPDEETRELSEDTNVFPTFDASTSSIAEALPNDTYINMSELARDLGLNIVQDVHTNEAVDRIQQYKDKICATFTKHRLTQEAQRDMLNLMRELPRDVQVALPVQGRTLRPHPIPTIIVDIAPGQFAYFGISNILSMPEMSFFDYNETVIRLTVNIDGVPVFHSSQFNFWPILGSIDNFPVFIIGIYGGPKKPTCSNEFLQLLIKEIIVLQNKGITIRGKTYVFVFEKLLMDAPAASYILGVKGHSGYYCCRKCYAAGKSVVVEGRVSKSGRECRVICFPDLDSGNRVSAEFSAHYDLNDRDPHNKYVKHLFNTLCDDDDAVISDDEEENEDAGLPEAIKEHHMHPTILAKLKNFDLIKNVPLDYMHLVLLGIMKKLLKLWVSKKTMLPNQSNPNEPTVSKRLDFARDYCPTEFQRRPENLDHLNSWKATQLRVFLLYVGAFVMNGFLDYEHLCNFQRLVVAMRYMTRKVTRDDRRAQILNTNSGIVKPIIRKFVEECIRLYGEEFVSYNVHNLIHAHVDYANFGPLDDYSCFRFESFLGVLKRLVKSGNLPLEQIINMYSNLLKTGQYPCNSNGLWDDVMEFYEKPKLIHEIPITYNKEDENWRKTCSDSCYTHYSEMRFRNFTLRVNNEKDRHCFVNGYFVRATKILCEVGSGDIFIVGKYYTKLRSLFEVPKPSVDVGLVVGIELSESSYKFPYNQIEEKCYAFPLDNPNGDWAIARFLHY